MHTHGTMKPKTRETSLMCAHHLFPTQGLYSANQGLPSEILLKTCEKSEIHAVS